MDDITVLSNGSLDDDNLSSSVVTNHSGDTSVIGAGPHNVPEWIVLAALFTIALPGFVGNVCVIVTVCKSRKLRQNVTFLKMASLSVSDAINNAGYWFVGSLTILTEEREPPGFWRHPAFGALLVLTWFSTQFHMDLIAVDRYIAVIHWHRYKHICTLPCTVRSIGVIWLLCVVLSVPFFAQHALYVYHPEYESFIYDRSAPGTEAFSYFSLACSAISPTLMMFCSARIILRLRAQKKLTAAHRKRNLEPTSGSPPGPGGAVAEVAAQPTEHVFKREEIRLTIQFILIFVAFTSATLLFNISLVLRAGHVVSKALDLVINVCHLLHFSINPFIYAVFSKRLRHEFLSLVSCRRLGVFVTSGGGGGATPGGTASHDRSGGGGDTAGSPHVAAAGSRRVAALSSAMSTSLSALGSSVSSLCSRGSGVQPQAASGGNKVDSAAAPVALPRHGLDIEEVLPRGHHNSSKQKHETIL